MELKDRVRKMKERSPEMAASSLEVRNDCLRKIAEALSLHKDEIFAANARDLRRAEESGVPDAVKKRLKFDEHKLLPWRIPWGGSA